VFIKVLKYCSDRCGQPAEIEVVSGLLSVLGDLNWLDECRGRNISGWEKADFRHCAVGYADSRPAKLFPCHPGIQHRAGIALARVSRWELVVGGWYWRAVFLFVADELRAAA
jgi:hypothetical protein